MLPGMRLHKSFVIEDFQGYAKFDCYLRERMGSRVFVAHILMISYGY